MRIDVPFFRNNGADGNQCFQVAMKGVLEYYLGNSPSLSELDAMTGRKPGYWTWPPQLVSVLHDLGLDVCYYTPSDPEPFKQGEPYIRKVFGDDADTILKHTDIPVLTASINRLVEYGLYEVHKLQFEEIEQHVQADHVPLLLVDSNVLYKKIGPYVGHLITITDVTADTVTYHDPGPSHTQSHRSIAKHDLIQAWSVPATDNDAIVILGKR